MSDVGINKLREEWERQRVNFESARTQYPELFEREPMIDFDAVLRRIGIEEVFATRPLGHLRLWPQDFIVEEIDTDSAIHTTNIETAPPREEGEGLTFYADLVKIGSSTLEVIETLSVLLGINIKDIGYAGIKDKMALTSQLISFRNVRGVDELEKLEEPNFFLKNIFRSKGVVANGDLYGNRFVITVRSSDVINPDIINATVTEMAERGFWNFFYIQRFGTPRLISHLLGLLLHTGDYEEVVKTFVVFAAQRELPYFKNIRKEMEERWGDWGTLTERMQHFPVHFHQELTLIAYLKENQDDFLGALHQIPNQVRLWLYAYDSFLFNRKLSEFIKSGSVPPTLPLITSFKKSDWEMYKPYLETDDVHLPSPAFRDFPFIRIKSRTWPTVHPVEFHGVSYLRENIAVFAYSIPKGAYATTVLLPLFTLATGLPIPPGIPEDELDAKELFGLGTLHPTLQRFKEYIDEFKRMRFSEEGDVEI